jgi:signal transduction histidine kinase/ligand-binding sensor domain-containing protein
MVTHRPRTHARSVALAALFLGLLAAPGNGRAQRLNVRQYSPADDLPYGQIYAVHQDARGFIWLASNSGFGRYDGRQFHVVTAERGLASNTVLLLDELVTGEMVAVTEAGLCIVGSQTTCVGPEQGLPAGQMQDLQVDLDGSVWVAAARSVSHVGGGQVLRTFTQADGLPDADILAMVRDEAGVIWVGTANGLVRLDGESWTEVATPAAAGTFVSALTASPSGLLVGTNEGLFRHVGQRWERVDLGPTPDGVRFVRLGPEGSLWVAGLHTLYRVANGTVSRFTALNGLPTQALWDVLVDREGNVWLGSDEGLAKIVPGPLELFTEAQGLPHPFVRALTLTDDGRLWFGTREGLAVWDEGRIVEVPFVGRTSDDRVYALSSDGGEGLLVGTAGGLVHRAPDGSLREYGTTDGLPHEFVRALIPDGRGGAWVGTARGVVRWAGGRIEPAGIPSLDGAPALSLARDSSGALWVGLSVGGVQVVEGDSVRVLGAAQGLSDQAIWSLAPDAHGGMWIGTNGDGAFHVVEDSVRNLTRADGLGDDFVWQVEVSSKGETWIFTGNGLNRVRPGGIDYFGASNGLDDLEGAAAAVVEDQDGDMWFGVGSGVYRYQPSEDRPLPDLPSLVLESVTAGGIAVAGPTFHFDPRPGAITFRFSVPSYADEKGIRFRHRLGGSGEGWSDPSPDPMVGFARLGSGEYRLEVMAHTSRGLRESEVFTIPFVVRPALWETWWFRLLVATVVAAVLLSVPALRARRLEAEQRRLEALITERTREIAEKTRSLELEVEERERSERSRKALESQLLESQKMEVVGRLAGGVAHDFNNLLSVVMGQAELLSEDVDPDSEVRAGLREILRSAQRGAELVSRLLAFSQRQVVRWERLDLRETIRDSLVVLGSMLEGHIALVTEVPDEPVFIEGDRSQLNQVLMNLVLNAKDAMPYGGRMSIGLKNVEIREPLPSTSSHEITPGRYAVLTVSDNGHGMDQVTLGRAFEPFFTTRPVGEGTGLGLATVYGIVEMHRGFLRVRSSPGDGTDMEVFLPEGRGRSTGGQDHPGHRDPAEPAVVP